MPSFINNMEKFFKKFFTTPVLLALFFLLMSHPLFYSVVSLAQELQPRPLSFLPGVIYYYPETGIKLLTYILAVPTFFLYYGFFFWLINHPNKKITKIYIRILRSCKKTLLWFIVAGIMFAISRYSANVIVRVLAFLFVFLFPLLKNMVSGYKILPIIYKLSVIFAVLWFCYIVLPPILFPLKVANEYLNIPTHFTWTRVKKKAQKNGEKELLAVLPDTESTFFKNYNPLLNPKDRLSLCMEVSDINPFVRAENNKPLNGDHSFFVKDNQLCFSWIMEEKTENFISGLLNKEEEQKFRNILSRLELEYNSLVNVTFKNKPQIEVLKKIWPQLHWQVLSRGFIHHHNHLFGPAHAYLKGQPIRELFMQYGFLNTIGLAWVLDHTVGFNYSTYIHFYYLFYPLYYICLFWFAWILFRDKNYLTSQLFLSVGALSGMTYLSIILGPGTNPARHFFDIFSVITFYLYLTKQSKRWLVLSLITVWLGILNNMHFGAFMFISLAGVLFIKNISNWKNKNVFELAALGVLTIISLALFGIYSVGSRSVEGYFLHGLLAFPFRNTLIACIFLLISLIYLLLAYHWKKHLPKVYVLLLLVFYSQGVLLYFLRSAASVHLYAMLPVFALTVLLALQLFFETIYSNSRKKQRLASWVIVVFSFIFFLGNLYPFEHSRKETIGRLQDRQSYYWTLPNTFFETTMPQAPFAEAANLINKYVSGPAIYLISQYDNILPIVSDKYNKMPFVDMQWYLFTPKEFNLAVDTIKKDKPEYLFVDADIQRNFFLDIIRKETPVIGYLYEESIWRAERLTQMQNIFKEIQNDYEPIESGELITVYKRKTV